jgi:flagellar motility protein MotE (MotC chaperone)
MSKILELREKRAKVWEAAKAFLDSKRGNDGLLSPEDTATYEKMEADVIALGKEIERLERQAAMPIFLVCPYRSKNNITFFSKTLTVLNRLG